MGTQTPLDDDILFAEEDTALSVEGVAAEPPWTVLVVDDDHEIHAMTRFMLAGFRFHGRPLKLLHAFSAAEAFRMLREDEAIALVLLDVVMETEDAGLRLVRLIRGELGNTVVRIVLRTGQPGVAPERVVLLDYDINDYKAKTELTADRMFTTVVTALRTFEMIRALIEAQAARIAADREAERRRAAMLALERRKADERKAELDAIALHLTMSVLPGLKKAAEQARLIPGIASHLESMSDGIGELLMTLRAA